MLIGHVLWLQSLWQNMTDMIFSEDLWNAKDVKESLINQWHLVTEKYSELNYSALYKMCKGEFDLTHDKL